MLEFYLKDVFGFAEQQEKGTFELSYKLTITRKTDHAVLNKGNAIDNARIKINATEWYVSHYTPSITQQNLSLNQIIKNIATELQYPKRCFHERS